MRFLDKLRRRHAYLSNMDHELQAMQLWQAVDRAMAAVPQFTGISRGCQDALRLDIIYAVLRNRHWLEAPLFMDVLTDFLASEYLLDRQLATLLTEAIATPLRTLFSNQDGPRHVQPTDDEYLRFVCVTAASAASEDNVAADLGIGRALLGRIRDALRSANLGTSSDEGPATFVPELDARIGAVVVSLAQEILQHPSALAMQRLRYLLIDISAPWSELLTWHGIHWLFDLLAFIGAPRIASIGTPRAGYGRGATLGQICAKVQAVCPDETMLATPVQCTALMGELARMQLVQPMIGATVKDPTPEKSHPTSQTSMPLSARWQLLPLAEDLTAEDFARNLVNSNDNLWTILPHLCPAYQSAVLKNLKTINGDQVRASLLADSSSGQTRSLAPAAWPAALMRLAEHEGMPAVVACITEMVAPHRSSWQRQAACDAIAALPLTLPVEQIMAKLAASPVSPTLKAAALRALHRQDNQSSLAAEKGQ